MAGMTTTVASIRGQIASAITLVVQLQRLPDGKRKVTSVSEITGMEGEVIQMQEIFRFVKESTDDARKYSGQLHGHRRRAKLPQGAQGLWHHSTGEPFRSVPQALDS